MTKSVSPLVSVFSGKNKETIRQHRCFEISIWIWMWRYYPQNRYFDKKNRNNSTASVFWYLKSVIERDSWGEGSDFKGCPFKSIGARNLIPKANEKYAFEVSFSEIWTSYTTGNTNRFGSKVWKSELFCDWFQMGATQRLFGLAI